MDHENDVMALSTLSIHSPKVVVAKFYNQSLCRTRKEKRKKLTILAKLSIIPSLMVHISLLLLLHTITLLTWRFTAGNSSSTSKSPLRVKVVANGKCQNFKGYQGCRPQIHNQDFNGLAPTIISFF